MTPRTPVAGRPPDPTPAPVGGREPSRAELGGVVALLAVVATVLATLSARAPGAPVAEPVEILLLLLLLLVSSFLGLEYRAAGNGNRVDLFDAALAAALISLPGDVLTVLVVAVKAVALTAQRLPLEKVAFNVAQWGCATAAGSLVLSLGSRPGPAVPRDLLLLPVALLVVAALNAGAVLLVLRRTLGHPGLGRARRGLVSGTVVGVLANLALGLATAAVWVTSPAARPVVPILLVAVHLGTRLWASRQTGHQRLTGMQRAAAELAGPRELAAALPRFVDGLRQAFDCLGVELRLDGRDGRPLRVASGPGGGAGQAGELLDALVLRGEAVRLSPPGGPRELLALLRDAGWRDCLAAPVRVDGQVVGVLCTHDRTGWEGFEHGELGVLEAAAGVLGEALARDRLVQVLAAEQAALSASEIRWRAFARVLEHVARGSALPDTLDLLARTVEEQTPRGRCAVLVRTPDEPLRAAAPSLPAAAVAALDEVVRSAFAGRPGADTASVPDLAWTADGVSAEAREALLASGVRTVSAWALPSAQGSGTCGVLVLACPEGDGPPEDVVLAAGAAKIGGLAVDHVLVHQRLAHAAEHDPLTGLANRSVFVDRLAHALRASERGSWSVLVLFLDLDRFKLVNDSLGHRAGDALLRALAERLRTAVRPGDTVARFGGDEFTILCEGIDDEAHALRVVERVQRVLERPFALGDSELFATASIGIALGHGRRQPPETLVENADAAMYRAKERGGNCAELFDAAMRERAVVRLATSSALHRAVERSEFRVVYQPTVRLTTGEVDGAEALVRWDRPGHGVVPPTEFIPLAEESGLVVPIGALVLEQACRQAARWDGPGSPAVSVNLSARQLLDPGLVPLVCGALERSDVDPGRIALEITESVLMADVTASGAVLAELKALGVRLLVDDFGTGYSSLTYLQRFPVDGVKVDRSFVSGLGAASGDAEIVGAVIGLAHSLGLVAIAEGVETQEQAAHLVELDCDLAQGYHFGRPGPPELVRL